VKNLLALILAVVAVGGCSSLTGRGLSAIDPLHPQIYVTAENRLVVNQEPIIVPRTGADLTITWQLPREGRAKFDNKRGITIDRIEKLLKPDGNPVPEVSAERSARDIATRTEGVRKLTGQRSGALFACRFVSDFEYSCTVPHGDLPYALYAYTIRVTIDDKPFELDPRFMY